MPNHFHRVNLGFLRRYFTGGVTVGSNAAVDEGRDVLLVAPSLASRSAIAHPPVTTDPDIFAIQDMDFLGGIFVG